MDDQRKDDIDPERPPKKNYPKKLQTHNMPTYDVVNTNGKSLLKNHLKKKVEHKSDVYINYDWCSWYSHRRINKGTEELENKRKSG